MTTLSLNNNESLSTGIFKENNGTFTVLTFTKSWNYKTEKAAVNKWNDLVEKDLV